MHPVGYLPLPRSLGEYFRQMENNVPEYNLYRRFLRLSILLLTFYDELI